jgi:YVTN family beta-propeller protein
MFFKIMTPMFAVAAAVVSATLQSSAPALLILNKTDATLVIVDPATNQIRATIPTGDGPHEVVTSTDGKLAFVSNYGGTTGGRTISVIDLATRKELRRVDVSPLTRPHGLAFHAGKLYFSAEANQVVGRYDPVADKVDAQFQTGQTTTHMVLISPDGRHMFTSNIRGNTVSIFDRGSAAGEWTNAGAVAVGRGPEGLDLSPDGKELWSAHSQDGGVSIIDVATRTVVATIDLKTKRSNRLKFTPDGARVLVSDLDTGELIVVDARARKELARVALGRMVEGILVTPDGSKAYVAENGDDTVAIVDLKTLAVTGRIKSGGGPDGMAWVR